MLKPASAALLALLALVSSVPAQTTYTETEPNDTRAQANGPFLMSSGDMITGASTGQATSGGGLNSFDYFQIQTAPATLGIYKHTLVLTSATSGNRFQVRGRSQFDGVIDYLPPGTSDASVVFDAVNGTGIALHTVAWYGFGRSETTPVSVFGSGTSTQPYTLTLTSTAAPVMDLGALPGGLITISTVGQGHTTDTDFWVYDSDFRPIPGWGNDDIPDPIANPHVTQSQMTRDVLTPGTYYLALSDGNVANDQASPSGDRNPSRGILDGGIVGQMGTSSSAANVNVAFAITDGAGVVHQYPATKQNSYDIVWVRFTLAAPATGSCCLPDGSCAVASQRGCQYRSGTYEGDAVDCGSVSCPQPPVGACCTLGNCVVISSLACVASGGSWAGAGSQCADQHCSRMLETGANVAGLVPGGVFLDVSAGPAPVTVTRIDYYCNQSYVNGTPLLGFDAYVHAGGSYLGNEFGATNTDLPAGWALNTTVTPSTPGIWTPIPVTLSSPVFIPAGRTVGFYLVGRLGGIRCTTNFPGVSSNTDITLYSTEGRTFPLANAPGWATATLGRAFAGRVYYTVSCVADFDGNGFIQPADVAAFVNNWFVSLQTGTLAGDFDGNGFVEPADVAAFVSVWFNALVNGC